MPGVPVTDNTARVTVEEVLRSLGTVDDYSGRDITVQLASPAEAGQRLTFFTRGWLYGQGVAVVEVARADAGERTSVTCASGSRTWTGGGRTGHAGPYRRSGLDRCWAGPGHQTHRSRSLLSRSASTSRTGGRRSWRSIPSRWAPRLRHCPRAVPPQHGRGVDRLPQFAPAGGVFGRCFRDQQERGAANMRVSGALTALDPLDFQPGTARADPVAVRVMSRPPHDPAGRRALSNPRGNSGHFCREHDPKLAERRNRRQRAKPRGESREPARDCGVRVHPGSAQLGKWADLRLHRRGRDLGPERCAAGWQPHRRYHPPVGGSSGVLYAGICGSTPPT